jgi:hypothetical protein
MTHEAAPGLTVSPPPRTADIRAVIEEFGRLLGVFGAQLTDSLNEANREFEAIGTAFQDLAAANERIDAIVVREPEMTLIRMNCERIGAALSTAVIGLQCHDRLAQRLGHIRGGLDHLHGLLGDGHERSYGQWLELLRDVERAQRTEQSRLAAATAGSTPNVELF